MEDIREIVQKVQTNFKSNILAPNSLDESQKIPNTPEPD
jgi:hypothetical protein